MSADIRRRHRAIQDELLTLQRLNLITADQRQQLSQRYPTTATDLLGLVRWFMIVGSVGAGLGLLLLLGSNINLYSLIEGGCVLLFFGLLGLAVFLNFFGLPRSAPVVGGLVLALLVLPTIIIAARAALKAVPPSIAEAALGVGASHQQAVFHHVLPLAMPDILTGTIIGMAHALGETAPLLLIGMVAFIVDSNWLSCASSAASFACGAM